MSELIVRKAEPTDQDYKKIIDLGMKFIVEHSMGDLSARDHNMEKGLGRMVAIVSYAAWIAEVDGVAVGSIALNEDTMWYSDKPHLVDNWFYVLPEFRKSGVGLALLNAAKEFAKERGLPLLIVIFNMEDVETKMKMMQHHGFKLAGGLFLAGE